MQAYKPQPMPGSPWEDASRPTLDAVSEIVCTESYITELLTLWAQEDNRGVVVIGFARRERREYRRWKGAVRCGWSGTALYLT